MERYRTEFHERSLDKTLAVCVLAAGIGLSLGFCAITIDCAPAYADSVHKGWAKVKSGKVYYRNDARVTGLQKIGKSRYYFTDKGVLKTKTVTAGGVTYYPNANGKLKAVKYAGKYYYAQNLKRMTSADAYDFETTLIADKKIRKITKTSDSKSTKLRKAFNYVLKSPYAIHRSFNPFQANWTAVYARDKIVGYSGDCHADGAAFAYLAASIGYKADVCLDAVRKGTSSSHCWAMIGREVYDPLFAETKSYHAYYGATSGTYETNPTKRYRVPYYSYKHAKKSAKSITAVLKKKNLQGLVKRSGSYYYYQGGRKVTSAWKTVNGKRYYFKSNGKAAADASVKIKGTYYLFNKKAQLIKPAQTKTVTLAGQTYRVSPSGKAASGWNQKHTKYYLKSGLLARGVNVVNKKFLACDASTGVYNAELTSQLRAAGVKGQPAASLRALLGKPKSTVYQESCERPGTEGLWVYRSFSVSTFTPADGGVETIEGYSAR